MTAFITTTNPAFACRCWVGNAETTDEERLEVARQAIQDSDLAVIGRIKANGQPADDISGYTYRDAAAITVEEIIKGDAPAEIILEAGAGKGVYDGRIFSNLLGTCGMSWRDGERNLWLLLRDDNGRLVLASSCAHSLVREQLYPELGEQGDE